LNGGWAAEVDEWEASAGTLRESKDEIRQQYEFLAKVLDSFPHPVYAIDAEDYTIKKASPSSLLPHSPEESTCYGLFHKRSEPCRDPGQPCPLEEVKKSKKAVVVDHIHHDKDGNTRYVEVNAYPILDTEGNVAEVIQYQSDITKRKKAEETVKELAYRDPLTGLPNRRIFSERLTLEIAHAWRDRQRLAVMFLDLDHFKDVNDMLGHDIGDKLLQAVAIRLRSVLRRSDTLARLGGDEFLLILPELTRVVDAGKIAQKILEAFQGPFLVRSYELYMSASIGIATYPKDGGIPDILIKRADIAMYQAKKAGRNNYRSYGMTPDSEHLSEREASEGKTKQVKTRLQQKEEEYRSLAADIGNVIWTTNSQGNTTFISPSVKRVYGYSPEEIYREGARLWFARTHPDDVQQVKEAYKRLFEKGERFNIQYRIKRKDERWIWLHHRAVATYERDGVLYADGVLSDITESKRGEETLRKAEEMLSGITERNFDAIYELDLEGRATYVSPAVERILGYKQEEVLGEFLQDYIPEGEMPKAAQALATVREGRNIERLQLEVVKKDGSRASVEVNASPIMRNGEVIGCQGIFRDITQRKKAEEELEESRSHFQSLFDLMVDPVVIVDGKGKILELTNGVQKVTGFKREELLGKNFMATKVVTAKTKAILMKNLAKRMMGVKIAPYEIEILTKDGKKIPIEANAAKITYHGKPADMAVFRDITERKRVEEALRESEEKFRNLSERSPNMIFINKKGRVAYANERCEEAMGYKRNEFYSPDFDFLTLIAPESKELIKSSFNRHMNGEEIKPYEYALITKDGKRIEAIITTKLINYEGESAILGIITDITERKRGEKKLKEYSDHLEEMVEEHTEELREAQDKLIRKEKLAVLGQLAGGVAHELRDPLGVISNAVYYLQMTLPDAAETANKHLEIISSQVQKSAKIISDLLGLGLCHNGSTPKEEIALSELLDRILARHYPPEKVEVTTKIASDLPSIFVDRAQIEQVLGNLIINAYQAMPGGGTLTVKAQAKNDKVHLSVTDTGCGIPGKNMKKLFEPLFTTKSRGIGLGLSVAKNLIELNEGEIVVESKDGKGCTFTVTLPTKKT